MDIYLDLVVNRAEVSPGRGALEPEIMVIGAAPSPNRPADRQNEPFGARSLIVLQKLIDSAHGSIYFTNLSKVPLKMNDKIPKKDLEQWTPLLAEEIDLVRPKKILVFGSQVAKVCCTNFQDMNEDHGTYFPCALAPDLKAFPTFHPSVILKSPELKETFLRDIQRFFSQPVPELKTEAFILVDSLEQVDSLIHYQPGEKVIIDIETTGLEYEKNQILMVGVQAVGKTQYLLVNPTKPMLVKLHQKMNKAGVTLIGHNLQFDLLWLMQYTDRYWGFPCEDTYLLAHAQGYESLSLKHLTTTLTNLQSSRAFGNTTDPTYLSADLTSTAAIHEVLTKESRPWVWENVLTNLIPETTAMRIRGVHLDRRKLVELNTQFQQEVVEREAEVRKVLKVDQDFNINSPKQLSELLIRRGVKLPKTDAGNYSVAEAVILEHAEEPWADAILRMRESIKALEFTQKYMESTSDGDPYLHPQIHFTASTGRTSMREPNLQQVTRVGPLKLLFDSRWGEDGKIGLVDLSQAELRIACLLSEDPVMMHDLTHGDIHRTNASVIYRIPPEEVTPTQRKRSKGVTFGVLYGGGAAGLAHRVGCDVQEVEEIMNVIFSKYKKLASWLEQQRIDGIYYQRVSSIFGRTRNLTNVLFSDGENAAARRAVNTPIQGVASDAALSIMHYICTTLRGSRLKSRVMFGIHDSILLDIFPGEEDRVIRVVRGGFKFLNSTPLGDIPLFKSLPLEGELIIGNNWAKVESTNENYAPISKHLCTSDKEVEFDDPKQDS